MIIKVQKFVIFPIVSIYSDNNELLREGKLRPFTAFSASEINLKKIAKLLEIECAAQKTESRGLTKDTGIGKEL